MTHKERADRRQAMATYCKNHGIHATAKLYGVSGPTVRTACWENDVKPLKISKPQVKDSTYLVIAGLQEGSTLRAVSKKLGFSHQRVAEIKAKAKACGIKFPT